MGSAAQELKEPHMFDFAGLTQEAPGTPYRKSCAHMRSRPQIGLCRHWGGLRSMSAMLRIAAVAASSSRTSYPASANSHSDPTAALRPGAAIRNSDRKNRSASDMGRLHRVIGISTQVSTAARFAVDCEIEHGEIARRERCERRSEWPNLLGLQRQLLANQLALFHASRVCSCQTPTGKMGV